MCRRVDASRRCCIDDGRLIAGWVHSSPMPRDARSSYIDAT
jgi:hypothetical protein